MAFKIEIPEKLKSRKLWMAIGAGVVVACNRFFDWELTEEDVNKILTMAGAYLAVEGGADLITRMKEVSE